MNKLIAGGLLAATALSSAPAQAAGVLDAMGPILAEAANAATLDAKCDKYVSEIEARQAALEGESGTATLDGTLTRYDELTALIAGGLGEFSLYLQRKPVSTFDDPSSFAKGECIATFRRTSLVVGTTVGSLLGNNVFSAHLIASTPFEFGGRLFDLAQALEKGITQFGTSSTTAIVPPPKGYKLVLPFTGSAIALGRPA